MGVPASPVSESIRRSAAGKAPSPPSALFKPGRRIRLTWIQLALPLALLLVLPLKDTRPDAAQRAYDHAHDLFLRGNLIKSQQEAEQGYARFLRSDPEWAARFQLLGAQVLIFRGMNDEALRALATTPSESKNKESMIQRLTLAGVAYTYTGRTGEATQKLEEARKLCEPAMYAACGAVPLRRGLLALRQGQPDQARQLFLQSLAFARTHQDRSSEASALLNLGFIALQQEHYDEAVDWSWAAYRSARDQGAEDLAENAMGNLGWAYYQLGDKDNALDFFLRAGQAARRLGSIRNQINWLSTAGYVYRDQGDLTRAAQAYRQSLDLATQIQSRQDTINVLEDLAHTDVMSGDLNDAVATLDKLAPLVQTTGNRLDQLDVMLAQGEIAAARRQDSQAESIFHAVERDPASQTSMRLGAEHQLARLYQVQGNTVAAETTYRTALQTFEAARAELKNEDSKLPFLANATPIYDDYIHFLVEQGRIGEALAAADQSRARTLAQGLGLAAGRPSLQLSALQPGAVAQKRNATVLFYWLGDRQSYLWAVTAKQTKLFPLPAQRELAPILERYRKALLEPELARDQASADGLSLYRTLVAPASGLIAPNGNVVVICDGPLSLLNFETLLAPAASSAAPPHYWIEDVNVLSAPSLSMLAAGRPAHADSRRLLLLGDALSADADYPQLPMAGAEIEKIEKHFPPAQETVFARDAATPAAYLRSRLSDYAYIHFVAHGVASRTDPLDSAIILSGAGDSFKLHARDIIQHPIDARLVTISACYGGGTRSYAGEGLVGLSWAFLRAGAHNVIGALWEASDDSTPQLMDQMYAGLAEGMTPAAALRRAKLALLHSSGKFRAPFYWAPFQLYAGL